MGSRGARASVALRRSCDRSRLSVSVFTTRVATAASACSAATASTSWVVSALAAAASASTAAFSVAALNSKTAALALVFATTATAHAASFSKMSADELTQVLPVPGDAPSQRTEIRIVTDGRTLFIGFRCWDTNPEQIVRNRKQRDTFPFWDDRVGFSLDTFNTKRNGYFFQTNPNAIEAQQAWLDDLLDTIELAESPRASPPPLADAGHSVPKRVADTIASLIELNRSFAGHVRQLSDVLPPGRLALRRSSQGRSSQGRPSARKAFEGKAEARRWWGGSHSSHSLKRFC